MRSKNGEGRDKCGDDGAISPGADSKAQGHNYSEQTLSHDRDLRRAKVLSTTSMTCKATSTVTGY